MFDESNAGKTDKKNAVSLHSHIQHNVLLKQSLYIDHFFLNSLKMTLTFLLALPIEQSLKYFTDTCFFGDGQSYRGNVSVTRSGHMCQSWSSQCPHRHLRTPKNFPELKNAGNACRNPGGQAPHGPWCYTKYRKVRWEYCRVDKCEVQEESKGLCTNKVSTLS